MKYCVRSPLNLAGRIDIVMGTRPNCDYIHYLRQYGGDLLGFYPNKPLKVSLTWIQRDHKSRSADERRVKPVVVTTGEDIGIPLADSLRSKHPVPSLGMITHGWIFKRAPVFEMLRPLEFVHYFCLSGTIALRLVSEYGIASHQVITTGYGVDSDFFRPPGVFEDRRLVLSAGTANRDYKTLLSAFSGLNAHLEIAADSEWRPRPLDIAGQPLPPRVNVRSARTYNQLRRLYGSASLVVVPLYEAPFACGYAVIAEAMAMGKAVIASRTQCHSDFILDGETGFYVGPGDVDDLRCKMEYLLGNPDKAFEMGARGRSRIEQLYSLECYSARMHVAVRSIGRNTPIDEDAIIAAQEPTLSKESAIAVL
jgi:glycosyltransferase involved in cell wall biosynthesis